MNTNRPLFLISNDDSYKAPGINLLTEIARSYGDVIVVSPETPQSGKSSAITMEQPLRARLVQEEEGLIVYAVNGTPADCVKLALHDLAPRTPDYVLSGINHGYNAGNSVIYSGTMGAVFEGSFAGISSMGFSIGSHEWNLDLSPCLPIVKKGIELLLEQQFGKDVCFNINIPPHQNILGLKPAINALGKWEHEYERRIDPFGKPYYWTTGSFVPFNPDNEMNDVYLLSQGYATIAPCIADQTHHASLPQLQKVIK